MTLPDNTGGIPDPEREKSEPDGSTSRTGDWSEFWNRMDRTDLGAQLPAVPAPDLDQAPASGIISDDAADSPGQGGLT
jgi:hypothetical protein